MKKNYESLSLELHLFFARIMKEHSLFLMTGFPAKNADYANKANWFRMQFEALLWDAVQLAENGVRKNVLCSDEIVTDFTIGAERRTSFLTGIPIDSRITEAERNLRATDRYHENLCGTREVRIRELNQRALRLTDGLIAFKEKILKEMAACQLFTFNYPLLVEHILREARLYRSMTAELVSEGTVSQQNIWAMESFWNRIMMEHALFIRGLLDPSEEELIDTADEFAEEYKILLEEAKQKDQMACVESTSKTIQETTRYRDFKAAGTKGITECKIAGLILPLLADHVLREANHYLRLLEEVRCQTQAAPVKCIQENNWRCNRRNMRWN